MSIHDVFLMFVRDHPVLTFFLLLHSSLLAYLLASERRSLFRKAIVPFVLARWLGYDFRPSFKKELTGLESLLLKSTLRKLASDFKPRLGKWDGKDRRVTLSNQGDINA